MTGAIGGTGMGREMGEEKNVTKELRGVRSKDMED